MSLLLAARDSKAAVGICRFLDLAAAANDVRQLVEKLRPAFGFGRGRGASYSNGEIFRKIARSFESHYARLMEKSFIGLH